MSRVVAACTVAVSLLGCSGWTEPEDGLTEADHALIATMVLPTRSPVDPTNRVSGSQAAAALGQQLFFDTTFSNPPGISCATCHEPTRAFSDPRDSNNVSQGVNAPDGTAQFTKRNSPGLLDAATYRWWGWDGRSDSLWMQCSVAFEGATTMAGSPEALADAMLRDGKYGQQYVEVFGPDHLASAPLTTDQIDTLDADAFKAMAAYIEQLVGLPSPFDLFANGQSDALTSSAQNGLKLFLGRGGCITCHNGPSFNGLAQAQRGGDFFKSVGVAQTGDHVVPVDDGHFDGITLLDASIFNSRGRFTDAPSLDRTTEVGATDRRRRRLLPNQVAEQRGEDCELPARRPDRHPRRGRSLLQLGRGWHRLLRRS